MSDSGELRRPRSAQARRYVEPVENVTDLRTRSAGGSPSHASAVRSAPSQQAPTRLAPAQGVSHAQTPSSRPASHGSTRASQGGDERSGDERSAYEQSADEAGVLGTLKRSIPLSSALVILGLGAGLGFAWHTPDVYTAETRLSVGSQELSAQAVPGYVLALQTMTSNYARYISTTEAVRTNLAKSLGPASATVTGVDASPIPESNILRIEVAATDPATAVKAADILGKNMVGQVANEGSGVDPALAKLTQASTAAASADQAEKAAQAALDALTRDPKSPPAKVDAARAALVDATSKADVLDVQQQALASSYQNAMQNTGQPATLSVIRPASVTTDDGTSSLERFGAFGLIIGAALAVGVAFLRQHSSRRRPEPKAPRESSGGVDWTLGETDEVADPYAASR